MVTSTRKELSRNNTDFYRDCPTIVGFERNARVIDLKGLIFNAFMLGNHIHFTQKKSNTYFDTSNAIFFGTKKLITNNRKMKQALGSLMNRPRNYYN